MINEKLILPCGAEIKNRFLKSAMTEGLAKSDATANKRHNNLYERWAKGGKEFLLQEMFKLIIDILNELVML